ncbi:MAG TPA: hypothetical protein VHL78_09355 [Actinomycetota bacterium]|nr:hypothetical protein [Actinomycetota bacterium]
MAEDQNTIARTLHDVGLGAWFGGSLMGALSLNRAAAEVKDPSERGRVASAGWARWTPVNLAAIGAYVVGGFQLMRANKARMAGQRGVGGMTLAKGIISGMALAYTGYARALGQRIMSQGDVPVQDGTTPLPETPEEVQRAQRQLKILQYAIPAHVAALIAISAKMGEQQRPTRVAKGIAGRFRRNAA